MSPPQLLQCLAALVPRPMLHLIRFHGVLAPHAKLEAQIVTNAPVTVAGARNYHAKTAPASAPACMSWACLLKRVFDIGIERCAKGGGRLQIIAAIEDPQAIVKILTHLGLPARASPRSLPLLQAA